MLRATMRSAPSKVYADSFRSVSLRPLQPRLESMSSCSSFPNILPTCFVVALLCG